MKELLTELPQSPFLKGCVALVQGLKGDAAPFSLSSLFEKNSLCDLKHTNFQTVAPVFLCDQVTSTFSVAKHLGDLGLLEPWAAVIAATQQKGKGQYNRTWFSPKGNLYVTFRLPNEGPFKDNAAAITLGTLLAIALQRLDYPVKIKWPNDLLNVADQKVAGILIEKRGDFLLAGLGINLSQLPNAEVLRQDRSTEAGLLMTSNATPCMLSPFSLWQVLVNEVIFAYSQFLAQLKKETLPNWVNAYLAWKDQAVQFFINEEQILHGWLRGISVSGGVLIETADGKMHEMFSGSLSRA